MQHHGVCFFFTAVEDARGRLAAALPGTSTSTRRSSPPGACSSPVGQATALGPCGGEAERKKWPRSAPCRATLALYYPPKNRHVRGFCQGLLLHRPRSSAARCRAPSGRRRATLTPRGAVPQTAGAAQGFTRPCGASAPVPRVRRSPTALRGVRG